MQNAKERGVRQTEHRMRRPVPGLADWQGAHLFLDLIRFGSFRSAADHLGISVNALRARITAFEKSLGTVLLTRHIDGIRPTAQGRRIAALVTEMEKTAFEMLRICEYADDDMKGDVRLSITEGLGAVWIGSRLAEFQEQYPGITLEVHAVPQEADILRHETEISVQLTRPTAPDLKVVKLGRLHSSFFASRSYIERHGMPKSIADLSKHHLLIQMEPDQSWDRLYDKLFASLPEEPVVAQRSNISSVHYWSLCRGAGIGLLPTYLYAAGAPLVAINLPIYHHGDIWMTFHKGAAAVPRVRKLAEWLTAVFSPKTYPWFRDEFIPPEKLLQLYKGKSLVSTLYDLMPNKQDTAKAPHKP